MDLLPLFVGIVKLDYLEKPVLGLLSKYATRKFAKKLLQEADTITTYNEPLPPAKSRAFKSCSFGAG